MKLFRTSNAILVEEHGSYFALHTRDWDELIRSRDLVAHVRSIMSKDPVPAPHPATLMPPIVSQEVWAAGVTYYRSRSARIEESKDAGGGSFYDRVYTATRPELFFKATGRRVVSPGAPVRIRSDAKWSVPEPELTLVLNPFGAIVGYTIGNDMSSRDIEGENPLYLPQAKVYDGSCALGPSILLTDQPLPKTTAIALYIERAGQTAFSGSTTLAELKRTPEELSSWLFRDNSFPDGVLLMTGTGIVPGDTFTLATGDRISISIDGVGTLENPVA
ncbi:MAG TPA: fumarylacetoacetate hydrolase family protein [Edaphobacter sp.]